jgi:tRNA dimethylallyltransferase
MMVQKLLIISGQTTTGKTNLGIYLAKKHNGEIVSFDSRQAYKYLDIITGKDFDENVKSQISKLKTKIQNKYLITYFKDDIPIWLYDLVDPKEYLNAFDFCRVAEVVIDDIIKRGKLPIIVGGAVFYINSFLEGFKTSRIGPNWNLRKELDKLTVEELQQRLKDLNKKRFLAMNCSDKNNKRRLVRAIEIEKLQVKSQKLTPQFKNKKLYDTLFLALVLDKDKLKIQIVERVEKRLEKGAINETKRLINIGYQFSHPGLNTLGYKQLKDYFQKKIVLEQAITNWIKAEIDYSRRQRIFLKKIKKVVFINPKDKNFLENTDKLVYKWYYEPAKN